MLSRISHTLKPRLASPFVRSFTADTGAPGADSEFSKRITKDTTPNVPRGKVLGSIIEGAANRGPAPEFENFQYTRRFYPQKTYHPGELNEANAKRSFNYLHKNTKRADPFEKLGIDPLKEYKNTMMLSSFVTDMGRIKPRYQTGLSAQSQRRVAQAIRRARSFGLIPVTSRFDHGAAHKSLGRGR
ncbi:hypothetical protein IWW50_005062 [Coemansia erecta]|nr:hypothetical protein IWW50_005062 [Coemansia erecta]